MDCKRDTDEEALPGTAENISYSAKMTTEQIVADLETKAKAKVGVYEAALVEKATITLNKWLTVPEQTPVPVVI